MRYFWKGLAIMDERIKEYPLDPRILILKTSNFGHGFARINTDQKTEKVVAPARDKDLLISFLSAKQTTPCSIRVHPCPKK